MIFFFYGEDSFRAHQKINEIKDKFKNNIDENGYNINYLDDDNLKIEDFFKSVKSTGFLAEKKLIIIRNIFNNKKLKNIQDEIINFLKNQKDNEEENYIIFWQIGKVDARSKLYKTLKKFKFTEEFNILPINKLIIWIKKEVEKNKKVITNNAINLLITYVGNNLWQLHQEINKLSNFCKKEIKEKDVKILVHSKTDNNIFNLIDALGNKNKKLALTLIENQLNEGIAIQYIITMIIRQFRLLLKIKTLLNNNVNQNLNTSTILKLPNFVIKKITKQSSLFNLKELKKIYQKLLLIDEKIKTTTNKERVILLEIINNL